MTIYELIHLLITTCMSWYLFSYKNMFYKIYKLILIYKFSIKIEIIINFFATCYIKYICAHAYNN